MSDQPQAEKVGHTAGPWTWMTPQPAGIFAIVRGAKDEHVAEVFPRDSTARVYANARLITASPDMLAALKMAEGRFADLATIISCDGQYDNAGFLRASAERLRAAIAKAEGR